MVSWLLDGRFLSEADQLSDRKVAVVDQNFVGRYWPDGSSAIGRRFANGVEFNEEDAITIVGVVAPNRATDLTETNPLGTIFHQYKERDSGMMTVVIRTELDPEAMGASLRRIVTGLDPSMPVDDIKVMQSLIDDSLLARRSPALLAGIFAGVALLLAGVGTYGVLAYAVGQRPREIGVRMALGALPSQILTQFLALGTKLLVFGIVFGIAGAWAVGRAMQSLLFGVETFSPTLVAITALIMASVVLLASLLPSRQASLVSPNEALRDE